MKRDMALIQALLEHVENACGGDFLCPPALPAYSDRLIQYHVSLCGQAGFLEVQKTTGADAPYARFVVRNLTWAGHEKLAELRR